MLVFAVCIITPWRLAFTDKDDEAWQVVWFIVNAFFVLDMILNFFMAFYDDEYNLIDDRPVIHLVISKLLEHSSEIHEDLVLS